jgi:hypothetical protein
VWVPDAIDTGLYARRLSQGAKVPLVFEASPSPLRIGELPTRLDLSGKTVRDALSILVELDPRYEWRQADNAIVIRPRAAWQDADNPLEAMAPAETEGSLADNIRQAMKVERSDAATSLLEAHIHKNARLRPQQHSSAIAWKRLAQLAATGEVFISVSDSSEHETMLEVTAWDGHSYRFALPPNARDSAKRRDR